MSAWRILVRNLHNAGGGPLPLSAFDDYTLTRAAVKRGYIDAKAHGVMVNVGRQGSGHPNLWQLTPKGVALAEGRLSIGRVAPSGGHWRLVLQPTGAQA